MFFFLDALTLLFSEKHETTKLSDLKDKVNMALALIERDFPVAIQVSLFEYIMNTSCPVPISLKIVRAGY